MPLTSSKKRRYAEVNQLQFRVLVIGSLHLDIISTASEHLDTLDMPGTLSLEVGGTAYNIASNFSALSDVQVSFLSALRDSVLSKVLVSSLSQNNVQTYIQYSAELPFSGFNAHLTNGQLSSAISAIALEQHVFEDSDWLRQCFVDRDFVVLDCNLSEDAIKLFSRICLSLKIPYAVCAVSESKAMRLFAAESPSLLSMNTAEYEYVNARTHMVSNYGQFQHAPKLITCGAAGLSFQTSTTKLFLEATHFSTSLSTSTQLGAGDAACCGFIYAYFFKGMSADAALRFARSLADQVLQLPNCNLRAADLLNQHLTDLAHAATFDALTGLYKRDVGISKIEFAAERSRVFSEPFCLLFLDIDFFKKINDTYGHAAGDLVLKRFAQLLKESLRDDLDISIRWGGEEFLVLLSATTLAAAEVVAERLRVATSELHFTEYNFVITVSGGLVEYTGQSIDQCIALADQLLYAAKTSGRNRILSTVNT